MTLLELNGFVDTAEDIRPTTPDEDAAYAAIGEDYAETARALLATVRRRLTGLEEDACEAAVNGDCFNASRIDSLKIQFAREIAAWKDGVRA
jgi:hypothetical protein